MKNWSSEGVCCPRIRIRSESPPSGELHRLNSGFVSNNVTEDEYTKTEPKDEILKVILKVLNYKIQNRSLVKQKVQ